MQYTVHAAKTNLSKLIEAALKGEEVVIARGTKPVVRIVPVQGAEKRVSILGALEHLDLGEIPDFFEPLPEDELRLWEGDGPEDLLGPDESHPPRG